MRISKIFVAENNTVQVHIEQERCCSALKRSISDRLMAVMNWLCWISHYIQ